MVIAEPPVQSIRDTLNRPLCTLSQDEQTTSTAEHTTSTAEHTTSTAEGATSQADEHTTSPAEHTTSTVEHITSPGEGATSGRPVRKRKAVETPVSVNKKKKLGKWEIESLMSNPKSPLVYINISELIDPVEWFEFTEEEKAELVQLLPEIDRNDANTNIKSIREFFSSNEIWRDALSDWQRSLDDGVFQESWTRSAEKAFEFVRCGRCDKWKDDQFERYWGQKQKLSHTARAGEQTNLKMTTIAEMGYFKKGDLWRYSRTFGGKGTPKTVVTKEVTLESVDAKGLLTFQAPRGRDGYIRAGQASTRFSKIAAPTMLETKILDEDGTVAKDERPNGNAWKNFRVSRAGEDLGTLFEVRGRVFIKK
ncbi:putative Polycomb group protein ASXL1 [Neolecta irregularis DAH-3]|uniref:Putative Polycomb group protein ASXL1 n=1 Tax=Neolecta irregularis (strain DAH-3) TaxID=1198029 RepID=A0A1U7LL47_NEOID|nr:putative Polycomb group protein ASXL1 [Neolecta irregularis DAH-3]|eukprot:OLL23380.1 putative Polycomb group protein ASXL1 [Neolecta irregularis DAH-3]